MSDDHDDIIMVGPPDSDRVGFGDELRAMSREELMARVVKEIRAGIELESKLSLATEKLSQLAGRFCDMQDYQFADEIMKFRDSIDTRSGTKPDSKPELAPDRDRSSDTSFNEKAAILACRSERLEAFLEPLNCYVEGARWQHSQMVKEVEGWKKVIDATVRDRGKREDIFVAIIDQLKEDLQTAHKMVTQRFKSPVDGWGVVFDNVETFLANALARGGKK